jgi:hypothetical protein
MELVISEELLKFILESCKELGLKAMIKRPHKEKSSFIDIKMQTILHGLLVEELACILSSTGLSQSAKLSNDLMGKIIVEEASLIQKFLSQSTKRENLND